MLRRFFIAGTATALLDGLFSSVLAAFFYGSSVTRLFKGVAATVFGPDAPAWVGVLMHIGVAFAWSAVFLIVTRSARIRELLTTRTGVLVLAAIYGPLVWTVMSLVVIPLLTHRPPVIAFRWWVQFIGHAFFVGLPITVSFSSERRRGAGRPY